MKNNILVSMVEYVLNYKGPSSILKDAHKFLDCDKYANFLNTPLNLGMFVPAIEVDGNWEVLEEPNDFMYYELLTSDNKSTVYNDEQYNDNKYEQYQAQKDKVIFEGFKLDCDLTSRIRLKHNNLDIPISFNQINGNVKTNHLSNIESMLFHYYDKPTLTAHGMQLSGLK